MDDGVHLQVFKCDFKVVRGSFRPCMVSHGMDLNTCFFSLSLYKSVGEGMG